MNLKPILILNIVNMISSYKSFYVSCTNITNAFGFTDDGLMARAGVVRLSPFRYIIPNRKLFAIFHKNLHFTGFGDLLLSSFP